MFLKLASCCGSPPVGPLPTDITPWLSIAICCGVLLLGEAVILLWCLWRANIPHAWRRWQVGVPATLGALALGVAALEWHTMRALSDVQPDAWHLAFQQRELGDWFDQMSAAFFSTQIYTELIMLATLVVLVAAALRQLTTDANLT